MTEVKVYSTNYCPYCRMAEQLLTSKGVQFVRIDVTGDREARRQLAVASGRGTVPQVFIGGEAIGGYDDLAALNRRGALDPLLGIAA